MTARDKVKGTDARGDAANVEGKPHRVTINVTPEFYEDLRAYATLRGITVTELIRQGLAYERFLYENRDSAFLLVDVDENGTRHEREIVLPVGLHRPLAD